MPTRNPRPQRQSDQVALHLREPVEQLEAEGRRLGVDAMGAADRRRVLELDGTPPENFEEAGESERISAEASLSWSACAVSTMSVEVSP